MKRSEVLKVIEQELNFMPNTFQGVHENFPKILANDILTKIEKLGMIPPARDADLKSSYGYARIWEWDKE